MIDTTGLNDYTDGKLQKVIAFAENHEKKDTLERCIKRLQKMKLEGSTPEEAQLDLYSDWAAYSLTFIYKRSENDYRPLIGGLIYHGPTGRNPLSVTLEDNNGWQLHT